LQKLGVERRVYTAGKSKSQLDPFAPAKPEDVNHLHDILGQLHDSFIGLVRERRAARVDTDHEDTFSGSFWTAAGARERGLIDGVGHLTDFLKTRFGKDVVIKKCAPQSESMLARLTGASAQDSFGPSTITQKSLIDPDSAMNAVSERVIWSRYGL